MTIYSHSRLSVYKQCPLKYKFRYLDRMPEEMQTVEAFMGRMVHDSLERLYKKVSFGNTPPLAEIIAHYRQIWDEKWTGAVKTIKRDITAEDYKERGRDCIERYYQRHQPFLESEVVGLEMKVSLSLDRDGKHEMRGFIDRLSRSRDGSYEIHDYKTAGHPPTQKNRDEDKQLALYHLAIQQRWSDVGRVSLHWHYLVSGQQITSSRTDGELEGLRVEKIALIDEIEATTEFPPQESALCPWCSYQKICPLRKHLIAVEELPRAEAKREEGFELVDRLADLQTRAKDIEAQIEETKRSLIAYSEREGAERVFGAERVAKIKREEKFSFPDTQKEKTRRAALEDAIREMGKWDEASSLDVRKLGGILETRTWDERAMERIGPFAEKEQRVSVTLSKRKSDR
ncbi:MAG: RecB family exonuclease [Deltaproteobacteria bacterium]